MTRPSPTPPPQIPKPSSQTSAPQAGLGDSAAAGPSPQPGWTARLPTFAATHVIVLAAATMVAISTLFGLLPQV